MALRRRVLRIDEVSLLESFGSLKKGISDTHQVVSHCRENTCLTLVYSFSTLIFDIFEKL